MNRDDVLAELLQALQDQQMQITALHSAYTLLVRDLERRQLLQRPDLVSALQAMAQAQPDEGWRACHAALATALQSVDGSPSAPPTGARPRRRRM